MGLILRGTTPLIYIQGTIYTTTSSTTMILLLVTTTTLGGFNWSVTQADGGSGNPPNHLQAVPWYYRGTTMAAEVK